MSLPETVLWCDHVCADPLPGLLAEDTRAVRPATLQRLLVLPSDDLEVRRGRWAAMEVNPIASILSAQDPAGWWSKPGPGYGPKYLGTVWQVVFLYQLGADPANPQISLACDYVLRWCPTSSAGLGCASAAREAAPPPSAVIHCLNGNLVRALIGFGRLDDERVQAAIDWAARASTAGTPRARADRASRARPTRASRARGAHSRS